MVNVTIDKCYENREWCWAYREGDPMGGYDPYSSSKGSAELVVAAYRRSYFNAADYNRHGVALVSARAGNVIGGGDGADDRLIPDMPVIRIVEWLASKWGNSASWTIETANHPHEAQYLKLDCSKPRAKPGWRPRWRLSTALERILDWHLAHCRGADYA